MSHQKQTEGAWFQRKPSPQDGPLHPPGSQRIPPPQHPPGPQRKPPPQHQPGPQTPEPQRKPPLQHPPGPQRKPPPQHPPEPQRKPPPQHQPGPQRKPPPEPQRKPPPEPRRKPPPEPQRKPPSQHSPEPRRKPPPEPWRKPPPQHPPESQRKPPPQHQPGSQRKPPPQYPPEPQRKPPPESQRKPPSQHPPGPQPQDLPLHQLRSQRKHQGHPPWQHWGQQSMTRMNFYTKEEFLTLAKTTNREIITDIALDIKKFQNTLENSQICKKNIEVVISLLFKVSHGLFDDSTRSKAINILGEVFSDRCATFQSNLKVHIGELALYRSTTKEKHLDSICSFFEVLLEKLPDSTWRILPVNELLQTVLLLVETGQLSDNNSILLKANDVAELQKLIKIQQHVTSIISPQTSEWDNKAFKEVQILPKWEEICSHKRPHQVRANIVHGKYDDWIHYFDIQFRLLREDFISPLRKGICDFKDGKVGRELRNVRLYKEVEIVKPVFTIVGLCYEIQFNASSFQHYKYQWEHSRRLIFGSLLCLIPESSGKTLFATVSTRDSQKLEDGRLEVKFHGDVEVFLHSKRMGSYCRFNMVESTAYFEASQHILRSLQEAAAEPDTMPFTDYLIFNECSTVRSPQYLTATSTYDIQFIIKKKERAPSAFTKVAVTNYSKWPTLEMTELDESQLKAIRMALTQEICVIQGPPGTGKTYIGLKIMQALLKNSHMWNPSVATVVRRPKFGGTKHEIHSKSPILVMCFTNHALDQFLEGILEMHKDSELRLIRIGGRSKSEKIQQCNIKMVKRNLKNIPRRELTEMKELYHKVKEVEAKCKQNVFTYNEPENFVGFSKIKCVIEEHHRAYLVQFTKTKEEERLALELWLGLYEVCSVEFDPSADYFEANPASMQKYSTLSEESSAERSSFDEDSSDNDTAESSRHFVVPFPKRNVNGEPEETIAITGEASIEEDARMLEDTSEMYKEIQFTHHNPHHGKRINAAHNPRHTSSPVKCKDYNNFKKWIMKQPEMKEREIRKCRNLQTMKFENRSRLYKYWHAKYKAYLLHQLEEECKSYDEVCERASKANQKTDKHALETADVIGITTTGAAKYQHILRSIKPKIVIVEEAAEVLESHIVSALNAGTQHLILIGDHKQLRPNPNEYDLAVKYKLDISLFERLVQNDFPHVTLQIQHRMRPEIADLVRGHIYDVLHDHDTVMDYPKVKGVSKNLFLIKHNKHEKGSDDLSHSNEYEAIYLVALCKFLLHQGYSPDQITVLVTYTGQLLLMKRHMPRDIFDGVRLATLR